MRTTTAVVHTPSVATIARLARMSERGVQTALGHLLNAGIITVDGRTATGTKIYCIQSTPAVVAPRRDCTPRSHCGEGCNQT